MQRCQRQHVPNTVLNAAPGNFSIVNMLKGPTSTVSAGSVSGLDAFIYACELLQNGQADAIVALSADEWTDALQTGNEKLAFLRKAEDCLLTEMRTV